VRAGDLELLERYGFDPDAFARWQRAVRSGELSPAGNAVRGALLPPPPGTIAELPPPGSRERDRLRRMGRAAIRRGELAVAILNGGMATRFGGGVKGLVEPLPGRSLLALKLADAMQAERWWGGAVPTLVMDSFATEAPTRRHLDSLAWLGPGRAEIEHLRQSVSLRMDPSGEVLVTGDGRVSPYPPGHGDFVRAVRADGHLERLLARGVRYLLVSGVDNVAARVSPLVLGHHLDRGLEATVEVAPKLPGDVGGAPYLLDGRVQVVEHLRFPPGFDPDVVDVLSTHTFTLRASALERDLELEPYYVLKEVQGRPAVQVERLLGDVTALLSTGYVRVARTGVEGRFLPIKSRQDLERRRADVERMFGAAPAPGA
jgi:UTP--glucose-1-phosphate uridylyltransferase